MGMTRLLAFVTVASLVAGCAVRPAPEAAAPVAPSPAPTPSPAAQACRLPAFTADKQLVHAGWLDAAGGQFSEAETFTVDAGKFVATTNSPPFLTGLPGAASYSHAAKRWLPARANQVSPDGMSYAYADAFRPQAAAPVFLHVVDVATGAERKFQLAKAGEFEPFRVIGYDASGILLTTAWEGMRGVWRADPATGALSKLSSVDPVFLVAGGSIWTGSVNPADPHPPVGYGSPPNQVDQLTFDGKRLAWLYRPGRLLAMIGLDARDNPIVLSYGQGPNPGNVEMLVATAPGEARVVLSSAQALDNVSVGGSDSHGTWMSSRDGVFLLLPAGDLKQVSSVPATVAGACQ